MPYITEELYQAYYKEFAKEKSIHKTSWPQPERDYPSASFVKEFDSVLKLIEEIRKWKSDNKFSQGKEVPEYQARTKIPAAYEEFVCQATRVKKII